MNQLQRIDLYHLHSYHTIEIKYKYLIAIDQLYIFIAEPFNTNQILQLYLCMIYFADINNAFVFVDYINMQMHLYQVIFLHV